MYLLDSSAWLVHLFEEPGVEQINQLFDDSEAEINISVLSVPEVYARLRALGREENWSDVWNAYSAVFSNTLSADQTIAQQAILLRANTPQRLPTIDALIAATAAVHGLILVHRDSHLAAIPSAFVDQIQLPAQTFE
ncbi:MAG: PIN domain-containing protein [Caldilineaceae bacterium]|nr:PIN domain-containing protein [Caldilineaceae bacterium]